MTGTTTPVSTYSDPAGVVPLSQPVVCNWAGGVPAYVARNQTVDIVWDNGHKLVGLLVPEATGPTNPLAGVPVVRKFPFAFDTPGLATGYEVWTPNAGDLLLDAWFSIDAAWDGTTPLGDIIIAGQAGAVFGIFTSAIQGIDMTQGDTEAYGYVLGNTPTLAALGGVFASQVTMNVAGGTTLSLLALNKLGCYRPSAPVLPTDAPLQVVVSQDGSNTGGDTGSTQGEAILYLITATPA
jgi:hypothetical protein